MFARLVMEVIPDLIIGIKTAGHYKVGLFILKSSKIIIRQISITKLTLIPRCDGVFA